MSKVVLVAQLKGGCAKSTTAMQVVAPWLADREGGARLIEVDHQNQDSADYANTEIKTEQIEIPESDSHSFAVTRLMERITTSDESIVIDLGGNATSSEIITEMGLKGVSSFVDLIVIPVSGSGRDVLNARSTIDHLKDSWSDLDAPILLAYSRAVSTDLERLKFETPDVFELRQSMGLQGPLVIPQKGCFGLSRYIGLTVWEVAQRADTMIDEIKEKQMQAKADKDAQRAQELVKMRTIIQDSLSLSPFFEQAFSELDALLPLSPKSTPLAKEGHAEPKSATVSRKKQAVSEDADE